MRAEEFRKYLKEPALLTKEAIPELQKLVEDFPYFQSAHLLLTLAAKKWDPAIYQQTLRKTAIVATNRTQLYKLVTELENYREQSVDTVPAMKEEKAAPVSKEEIKELVKEELNLLKEAEISSEESRKTEIIEPQKEPASTVEKEETNEEILTTPVEEQIELELEKAVVNAFVEKEILKTHELHKSADAEEPESFAGWLQFLKKNNGQPYAKIEEEVNKEKVRTAEKNREKAATKELNDQKTKEKKKAIIDKIIETNPGAIRQKEEQKFFKSDFKARESLVENEHLVTETLARIYALQGNTGKAIRAYEILSLKFPQKSAYFATLIEKLKNNQ